MCLSLLIKDKVFPIILKTFWYGLLIFEPLVLWRHVLLKDLLPCHSLLAVKSIPTIVLQGANPASLRASLTMSYLLYLSQKASNPFSSALRPRFVIMSRSTSSFLRLKLVNLCLALDLREEDLLLVGLSIESSLRSDLSSPEKRESRGQSRLHACNASTFRPSLLVHQQEHIEQLSCHLYIFCLL